MRKTVSRGGTLACLLACISGAPVAAATGQVIDPEGRPIEGAEVCYVIREKQGVCVKTDERGYYELAPTHIAQVRIFAQNYLPRVVAAVNQSVPVALERAAALHVKVLDAETEEGIPESQVIVQYPSGEAKGPVPANAHGVILRSLAPGAVVIGARAPEYREAQAGGDLKGGEKTTVVVRLERDPAVPAPPPDDEEP